VLLGWLTFDRRPWDHGAGAFLWDRLFCSGAPTAPV